MYVVCGPKNKQTVYIAICYILSKTGPSEFCLATNIIKQMSVLKSLPKAPVKFHCTLMQTKKKTFVRNNTAAEYMNAFARKKNASRVEFDEQMVGDFS